MIDWELFRGRRVFITGDTGFKGSWLAFWLRELGAEVVGFALPPERPSDLFSLLGLSVDITHIDGDVRDGEQLRAAVDDCQPEIVFHLAAQALVRRGYREPKRTFDTNVGGTVNILEAVRDCPAIRAAVIITSDKCYRNKEWTWGYRENDELGGYDPYSASKAAAENVFAAYRASFESDADRTLGVATARAGNVIGGGDRSEDRIVPDCIAALEKGQPLHIRKPRATRPWQHVMEPLSGYLTLASGLLENPSDISGSWNFGPGNDDIRTVDDVAREIVSCWGSGEIENVESPDAMHEAGLLHLNCDKARMGLDWTVQWGFKQAIRQTVDWYRKVGEGSSAATECRRQIREYMDGSLD